MSFVLSAATSRFRFIHAADLHLDSPLVNLERYDGAPVDELRGATRRALENLVELAIREEARFVLVAGDLFDGDCRDFNTPLFLRSQMATLAQAGIDVLIVQGNHDAQTRMKKAFRLQLPPNVHLFSTRQPETFEIANVQVAIHGQGFADEAVTEDLSARFPDARRGWLNVGLLHTTVHGYEGRGNYAPSTVDGLSAKGYDYWALGHVHGRAVVRAGEPWIVYPGCIQGRHVNEPGDKGCMLVTVDGGQIVDVSPRPLDVVRWTRCTVDAAGAATVNEVMARLEYAVARELEAAQGRLLAARVEVTGPCAAHGQLVCHPARTARDARELVTDRFGDRVWVESVKLLTQPAVDMKEATARDDALGALLRALGQPEAIREALADAQDDLNGLLKKIPADGRIDEGVIDLHSEAELDRLAQDVQRLLIPLLLAGRQSP